MKLDFQGQHSDGLQIADCGLRNGDLKRYRASFDPFDKLRASKLRTGGAWGIEQGGFRNWQLGKWSNPRMVPNDKNAMRHALSNR